MRLGATSQLLQFDRGHPKHFTSSGHTYIHFQVPNNLLNDAIRDEIGCSHKLKTISDTPGHILSKLLKVTLAIKFALNWRAAPLCSGQMLEQKPMY